eukprot:COSAG02_NODE_12037_length_1609_cov_1.372848_1_plen_164_part_00
MEVHFQPPVLRSLYVNAVHAAAAVQTRPMMQMLSQTCARFKSHCRHCVRHENQALRMCGVGQFDLQESPRVTDNHTGLVRTLKNHAAAVKCGTAAERQASYSGRVAVYAVGDDAEEKVLLPLSTRTKQPCETRKKLKTGTAPTRTNNAASKQLSKRASWYGRD